MSATMPPSSAAGSIDSGAISPSSSPSTRSRYQPQPSRAPGRKTDAVASTTAVPAGAVHRSAPSGAGIDVNPTAARCMVTSIPSCEPALVRGNNFTTAEPPTTTESFD